MKIAIIGGRGKMGQWMARFLQNEGEEVLIADRNPAISTDISQIAGKLLASNREALEQADAIILSVPLDAVEEVSREISPVVKSGHVIIDISSVKGFTLTALHRHIKKGTLLGVHPMFGPGADGLAGRSVVLTPEDQAGEELAGKARQYLEGKGAKVKIMSPAEHDEIMSVVLGLAHFIALASADALLELGKLTESRQSAGTTYGLLLTYAESVINEDPALYSALQKYLPGAAAVERVFLRKAGEWLSMVEQKDGEQFTRRMNGLKEGFRQADPRFGQAYRDMYRLLDRR
jgi:prephenate dehydrogenase